MIAALLGAGALTDLVVRSPSWGCSIVSPGYLVLDLDPYLSENDLTTLQIGNALGTGNTEPDTPYLVNDTIGNVEGDDVELNLSLFEAQQYQWFVRYVDIEGGTADTEWIEFSVADPGCGDPGGGAEG